MMDATHGPTKTQMMNTKRIKSQPNQDIDRSGSDTDPICTITVSTFLIIIVIFGFDSMTQNYSYSFLLTLTVFFDIFDKTQPRIIGNQKMALNELT